MLKTFLIVDPRSRYGFFRCCFYLPSGLIDSMFLLNYLILKSMRQSGLYSR